MEHLAGSEQRDAHEFLHGFLELVGKHMSTFRSQVRKSLGDAAVIVTNEKKDGEYTPQKYLDKRSHDLKRRNQESV